MFAINISRKKGSILPKDCPSFCECKWKKGKETVECVNANLTSVPEGLNADTQVKTIKQSM